MKKDMPTYDIPIVHVLNGKEVSTEEVIKHIRERQAEKENKKKEKST